MTALTDRYVHATLRAAPSSQRTELEPEIRALVADTVDAHGGDERAALTSLGDPAALAARYADRPQHLIGPALFPTWQRLLTLLLPIIVPVIGAVVLGANLLGGAPIGQALVQAGAAAISVGIQTAFWFTVVFAVIERLPGTTGKPARDWSVDDLPELTDDGRIAIFESGLNVFFNVLVVVGLLWVQLQPPIVIEGEAFALFDPALWSFWLPWFLVVAVAEVGLAIVVYLRRRWTYGLAVANAALGAAFAIPAIALLQEDRLFNPALVERVSQAVGDATWIGISGTIVAVVVAIAVLADAADVFVKAHRATEASKGRRTVAA